MSSVDARRRAAMEWPVCDVRRHLEAAAALLDADGEHLLADWLLCCRIQFVTEVATGVAAHALRRHAPLRQGEPNAYDLLITTGIASFAQASEWFFDGNGPGKVFDWGPDSAWLHD